MVNSSCKIVRNHMVQCEEVAVLFATGSSKLLDPEAEYVRFREQELPDEKSRLASERISQRVAEDDIREQARAARRKPKDILDD